MKTVWKFILTKEIAVHAFPRCQVVELWMPAGAKALSVEFVHDQVWLWAFIPDKDSRATRRRFLILGTGEDAPEETEPARFVGTYVNHVHAPTLVNHVFELPESAS